jgi:penicillin-binding protein 2
LFVLRVLVVSLVATLVGRLFYVQVLSGPTYRAQATANEVRALVTPAPRGEIVDDEGRPLADDRDEYVVTVDPTVLSAQKDSGAAVLARLAPVVGESVADLKDKIRLCGNKNPNGSVIKQPCYAGSPYAPIPVKDFDPTDTAALQKALLLQERSELFPGIAISSQEVRQYPYGSVAGQELGYLEAISAKQLTEPAYKGYQSTDLVGQSGLEQEYDKQLRGTDSVQNVSVDAAGNVTGTVSQTQPVPGDTLVTNLDAGLQQQVEKSLAAGIKLAQSDGRLGTTAAAVVMNVHTGAVYALASLPDYDPNQFTGGISAADYAALTAPTASNPLISRAFSAAYPPGSTFKISSAATILQNGLATASTPVECGSSFPLGTSTFHNFEGEAKGEINLIQAIQYSCDIYFYRFAAAQWYADGNLRLTPSEKAHPDRQLFATMAKAFGYGSPTGIDLPNESSGILYDRAQTAAAAAYEQKQACIGAKTHPTQPAREAADAKICDTPSASLEALTGGDAIDFAIGQGGQVNVTLLQQAVAYAAVANGGTRVVPQIAKAFISPSGKVTLVAPKTAGRLPVSAANLASIRQGFMAVTQDPGGTGAGLFPIALDVSGKSGTADVASSGVLANEPESWFASYYPSNAPKYVTIVMVEHGSQGAIEAGHTNADILNEINGLSGKQAVWPKGTPPTALPKISATGAITAPQTGIIGVVRSPGMPGGTPDPIAVANQVAEAASFMRRTTTGASP